MSNKELIKSISIKTGLFIAASFIIMFLLMIRFNLMYSQSFYIACLAPVFFWVSMAFYSYKLNLETSLESNAVITLGSLSGLVGFVLFGIFFLSYCFFINTSVLLNGTETSLGINTIMLAALLIITGTFLAGSFSFLLFLNAKRKIAQEDRNQD